MSQGTSQRANLARFVGVTVTLVVLGALGALVGFLQTVRDYATLPTTDEFSPVLGAPIGVFTLSFGVVTLVLATAILARGRSPRTQAVRRDTSLGLWLLVLGAIGWYAAFALAADKVQLLLEPSADLSCNVSLLVQCGTNLDSWQGSVFGFPNPLLGIASWAAVFTVGCLLLAGIRLARWFWIAFTAGVVCTMVFVVWFIGQSVFVLGTLCPWCMATWAVTIPLFWAVTLRGARDGHFGTAAKRVIGRAYGWVPLITVASYLAVAVIAQLRLDVLSYL
ncbi:vitamin K epoxide reductase family protein [Homoserinimonas sp. A447]